MKTRIESRAISFLISSPIYARNIFYPTRESRKSTSNFSKSLPFHPSLSIIPFLSPLVSASKLVFPFEFRKISIATDVPSILKRIAINDAAGVDIGYASETIAPFLQRSLFHSLPLPSPPSPHSHRRRRRVLLVPSNEQQPPLPFSLSHRKWTHARP